MLGQTFRRWYRISLSHSPAVKPCQHTNRLTCRRRWNIISGIYSAVTSGDRFTEKGHFLRTSITWKKALSIRLRHFLSFYHISFMYVYRILESTGQRPRYYRKVNIFICPGDGGKSYFNPRRSLAANHVWRPTDTNTMATAPDQYRRSGPSGNPHAQGDFMPYPGQASFRWHSHL